MYAAPSCKSQKSTCLGHYASYCQTCYASGTATKYWCGYVETGCRGRHQVFKKTYDADFAHPDFFLTCKSFGVDRRWARRWRYKLYAQRASFVGEKIVFESVEDTPLPAKFDKMLLPAWVRLQMWRRAGEVGGSVQEKLAVDLLELEVEDLISKCQVWYDPLMQRRRIQAWRECGDRLDICAMDGNAKIHRRACGAPCAEAVYSDALALHLIRGCSASPLQQGVLCASHADLRATPALAQQIESHRMRSPLGEAPFLRLDIRLAGCCNWQPACTIDASVLQSYLATKGGLEVERRRQAAAERRAARFVPMKRSFLGNWSSESVRTTCKCKTHKEGVEAVKTASRTAGFMLAVTESGIIGGLAELVTAETLSQRYCFLADIASQMEELKILVHDDACHVRVFAKTHEDSGVPLTVRLAREMLYVVDRPHSRGHVDPECIANCFPTVAG